MMRWITAFAYATSRLRAANLSLFFRQSVFAVNEGSRLDKMPTCIRGEDEARFLYLTDDEYASPWTRRRLPLWMVISRGQGVCKGVVLLE